jgi:hypothetical protein
MTTDEKAPDIANPENTKARYQVRVNITLIGSKPHGGRD